MIQARGVAHSFGARTVLDGVDLEAADGQVVGLVGPNGSGKTTLLRTFYRSLAPQRGSVLIDSESLERLPAREVARRVSVVVQETPGDLPLLVRDMVLLGRTPHRSGFARRGAEDDRIAAQSLSQVGALHLAEQPFDGLSGGERQRVLIARALTQQASHLLLDEPTNHLDVRYAHELLDLTAQLAREGRCVVVVLHDLNLAAAYCDRVVLLENGQVRADGTPSEVLVPEHLEPVYQVRVRRLETEDGFHLAFRPQHSTRTGSTPPAADPAHESLPVPAPAPAPKGSTMTALPETALDPQAAMNAYWTTRAPAYDDEQLRAERRDADAAAWSQVYREALGPAPLRVLDVGTGSGYVANLLAGLSHDVDGVDLAEGMIARAREHAAARAADGTPAARFSLGDAVAPEFAPHSFDALVNRYVMWTLREPKTALDNWRRLLRPGGTLALVDANHFPEGLQEGASPEFAAAYDDQVGAVLPLAEARTIDALVSLVEAAGFLDVTATELRTIHDLDTRLGVSEGHEVRLQYLVRGTAPA